MALDLLAIGEVMAEIRQDPQGDFTVGFAGDTYNTAVYCARSLGPDARIGYKSRVGEDPLSQALVSNLKAEGLEGSEISIDDNRNIGIYSVATDKDGERSFHYWREQSAARRLFQDEAEFDSLDKARVVYLSGITLAILEPEVRIKLVERLGNCAEEGRTLVAFDSNYRPGLWVNEAIARDTISAMWSIADIALPSIDDEMALFGETEEDVIERFRQGQWKACAIKRGGVGPYSPTLDPAAAQNYPPAPKIVDTTAAGDSFNAGYLSAFLRDEPEADCLMAGHMLARDVVQVSGAIAPR